MTRSGASVADRALLAEVANIGGRVTASQLQRWRAVGLVPAPHRTFPGGGGSASSYEQPLPQMARHVAAVAARSRRGRPYALTAVAVTADGYTVNDRLLRAGHRLTLEPTRDRFGAVMSVAYASGHDELDGLEILAHAIADSDGDRAARARLAKQSDLVGDANVEDVYRSAMTALVALVAGVETSPESILELASALGLRQLADDMLGTFSAKSAHADIRVALPQQGGADRSAAVAELLRAPFAPGPVMPRLVNAVDNATGAELRLAARMTCELWRQLDNWPGLAAIAAHISPPTGDSVTGHSFAVAALCLAAADTGLHLASVADALDAARQEPIAPDATGQRQGGRPALTH